MHKTDYESIARKLRADWEIANAMKTNWHLPEELEDLERRIITALRETAEPLEKEIVKWIDRVQVADKHCRALEERVKFLEAELMKSVSHTKFHEMAERVRELESLGCHCGESRRLRMICDELQSRIREAENKISIATKMAESIRESSTDTGIQSVSESLLFILNEKQALAKSRQGEV